MKFIEHHTEYFDITISAKTDPLGNFNTKKLSSVSKGVFSLREYYY